MNDAEYLFKQTSLERKRIGRGDYNKKRQGGKTIRFPSDYLTKKEREMMNGNTKTYHMERPVKWADFKNWPDDLKRAYLLGLREKFHAFTTPVASMLGVSTVTLSNLQRDLGIPLPSGGKRPALKVVDWERFLNGEPEELPQVEEEPIPEAEPEFSEPEFSEPKEEPKPEAPKGMDFDRALSLAMVLLSLQGSGTKLTIEVTL